MSSSVNCFSNLPAPPVSIVGWNSATEIANQLANALVDTNTFTIVGATYSSTSTRSAGLATFRQYGTWARNAGKPPGHMLAPQFPNGAVVLSTAQILGTNWPKPLLLTPGRVAPEINDTARSVKLVLDLKAKIDGSLRMRWVWQDTQANIWAVEEGNPTSGNNTFRIRVNGALWDLRTSMRTAGTVQMLPPGYAGTCTNRCGARLDPGQPLHQAGHAVQAPGFP
jgi:hypothetical protein